VVVAPASRIAGYGAFRRFPLAPRVSHLAGVVAKFGYVRSRTDARGPAAMMGAEVCPISSSPSGCLPRPPVMAHPTRSGAFSGYSFCDGLRYRLAALDEARAADDGLAAAGIRNAYVPRPVVAELRFLPIFDLPHTVSWDGLSHARLFILMGRHVNEISIS